MINKKLLKTIKNNIETIFFALIIAIIIRSLPNNSSKINKQYSNTNPAFISEEAALEIRNRGIRHFMPPVVILIELRIYY